MAASAWRLGGLGGFTVNPVRITDAPHSVIGVGYRAPAAGRPEIRSFVDIARTVTAELIGLVPDAVRRP